MGWDSHDVSEIPMQAPDFSYHSSYFFCKNGAERFCLMYVVSYHDLFVTYFLNNLKQFSKGLGYKWLD